MFWAMTWATISLAGALFLGAQLHADTYRYVGSSFTDPNSWVNANGQHGLPTSSDTAQFGIGTITATPSGSVDVLAGNPSGGSVVTFAGGSLTVNQAQGPLNLDLQGSSLQVFNPNGIGTSVIISTEPGSLLTLVSETAANVMINGGTVTVPGDFAKYLSVSAGTMNIGGDATLDLQLLPAVDGPGSTLNVGGTLTLSNGQLSARNGGAISNGPMVLGPDAPGFIGDADAIVDGASSQWMIHGLLQVGLASSAAGLSGVAAQDGGSLTAESLDIGVGPRSTAIVIAGKSAPFGTRAQTGGSIKVTGPVRVGIAGYGSIQINGGGHFEMGSSSPLSIGVEVNGQGSVSVDGPDTTADLGGTPIHIGEAGAGGMTVSGTNQFTSGPVQVAVEKTSGQNGQSSVMGVTGMGTSWSINGALTIGVAGNGSASIDPGADLHCGEATLGSETNSTGFMVVSGLGGNGTSTIQATWQADGDVTLGEKGSGTLTLFFGGNFILGTGAEMALGSQSGATGIVYVDGTHLPGAPTLLDTRAGSLTVGDQGQGAITNSAGGQMLSGDADIGSESGSQGTVLLTDSGTTWTTSGDVTVGAKGSGQLLVQSQAVLSVGGDLVVGDEAGSKGQASFAGPGTNVRVNGKLVTGASSSGSTLLELGASVQADSVVLGDKVTGTGTVSLSGGDALLATRTDLTVGSHGLGNLNVTGPATVQVGKDATVAEQLDTKCSVKLDAGGMWIVEGDLTLAGKGLATVSVNTGSQLFALGSTTLAEEAGSGATLTLNDRGTNGLPATLKYAGTLSIGEQGNGSMVLTNNAVTLVATNGTGLVEVAPHPTAVGTLSVHGTNSFFQAATLTIGVGGTESGGKGTVSLLEGGELSAWNEVEIGPAGLLDVRNGAATVGATNPVAVLGSVQINPDGRLSGCGRVRGLVFNAGGEVAPGCSPGTLVLEGDYAQNGAGALTIRVAAGAGGAPTNDVLQVTGNVTLAGKLTIDFIGGFAPQQGQTFSFIQPAGTISGTFDQVVINGLAPGFQYQLAQSSTRGLSFVATSNGVSASPSSLSITSNANQLQVSWPATATGYLLQSSTNLDSTNWTTLDVPTHLLNLFPTNTAEFFRLMKP